MSEHWFIQGQNVCQHCGMTLADVRTENVYRMLTETFDRLAAVLERMEAKS